MEVINGLMAKVWEHMIQRLWLFIRIKESLGKSFYFVPPLNEFKSNYRAKLDIHFLKFTKKDFAARKRQKIKIEKL